jgi:hypothetical protein
MHLGRFFEAWFKDWIALMSGAVSVGLLFWATLWPPSQAQGKQILLILSAVCFVFGSYRIWAKQYQRVCDLTGKTPIEGIDDLILEFTKLEDWYASDKKTSPRPLERLIEKGVLELRHHAPNAVHRFKDAATNPKPEAFLPLSGRMRTIEEVAEWRSDKKREECWKKASSCLDRLKAIRQECVIRSQRY